MNKTKHITQEGWQPIETAPKDCDVILTDGIAVTYGGWVSDMDQGAEWEGQIQCAGWWTIGCNEHFKPTLWQPLPPPPTQEGGGMNENVTNGVKVRSAQDAIQLMLDALCLARPDVPTSTWSIVQDAINAGRAYLTDGVPGPDGSKQQEGGN